MGGSTQRSRIARIKKPAEKAQHDSLSGTRAHHQAQDNNNAVTTPKKPNNAQQMMRKSYDNVKMRHVGSNNGSHGATSRGHREQEDSLD